MLTLTRVPGDFVARAPRDLLRIIPGTRPTERVCLGCGKLFTDTSNARRHVRRMHLVCKSQGREKARGREVSRDAGLLSFRNK